ncbi:MAG: nuclear transport factor 2 family protein, partial [Gammaproteobacteria bacterium]|nr:nuclear transport factor 2 family protein [Gammaproteobacteria bacterium]
MNSEPENLHLKRRDLILSAGLLAALGPAVQEVLAGGHTAPRALLSEDEQLALEKANDELITNFIKDYATRDVNVLAEYMADDIVYQISEGQPEVVGIEAYKKRNGAMFDGLEKVDWGTLR